MNKANFASEPLPLSGETHSCGPGRASVPCICTPEGPWAGQAAAASRVPVGISESSSSGKAPQSAALGLPLGRDVVRGVNVHVGPWTASGHPTPPPRPFLRLGIVLRASTGLLTRLLMETCTGGAQGSSSPRELIQALPQEPPPHPQPLVTNAASGV